MKTINTQQLETILASTKGFTFIELDYTCIEPVKKKQNINFIDYPIYRHTKINVGFNGGYQNSVNNRLEKKDIEPDFKAQSLRWGKWKIFNKFIEHNGNIYVRFYLHKNSRYESEYIYNGKIVQDAELNELYTFLSNKPVSLLQYEAGLEIEEQCKPFNLQINNINFITINKQKYEIISQ